MSKTLTHNEVLQKSRELLTKQGAPALSGNKGCLYRTQEGLACAVGILLSDEDAGILDSMGDGDLGYIMRNAKPDPDDEYQDSNDVEAYQALSTEAKELLETHEELLIRMQTIHDEVIGTHPVPLDKFVPHIQKGFDALMLPT